MTGDAHPSSGHPSSSLNRSFPSPRGILLEEEEPKAMISQARRITDFFDTLYQIYMRERIDPRWNPSKIRTRETVLGPWNG